MKKKFSNHKMIIFSFISVFSFGTIGCSSNNGVNFTGNNNVQEVEPTDDNNTQEIEFVDDNNTQELDYYLQDNDTYYVAKGNSTMLSKITIPSTYKGKKVTGIMEEGFSNVDATEIVLPKSLHVIGIKAFRHSNLKKATIPSSVLEIGQSAFMGCPLEEISLPFIGKKVGSESYEGVFGYIFNNSTTSSGEFVPQSLKAINISTKSSVISSYAFSYCKYVENINIDGPINRIEQSAFQHCESLKSFVIPETVKNICSKAFEGCKSMTSLTIPGSVVQISDDAFEGCSSLAHYSITGDGTNCLIYDYILYLKINSIYHIISVPCVVGEFMSILEGAVEIPEKAFFEHEEIRSIRIPDSVTLIGANAFAGCVNLEWVHLPNSNLSIGNSAFSGCSWLGSIEFPPNLKTIGDEAFKDTGLYSIVLPNGLTEIGNGSFYGCEGLRSVELPSSLKTIGDEAFKGCKKLATLVLPEGLTKIGKYAFSGCSSLATIDIPNGVESIGCYAFDGCSLFKYNSFNNALYLGNATNRFLVLIKVSSKSITECKINSACKHVYSESFRGCTDLFSLTIPNNVISIGEYAFYGSALRSIDLGSGVKSIESHAFCFLGSYYFNEIIIPISVVSIGAHSFYNCNYLNYIYCRASSKPSGWHYDWAPFYTTVMWGYTGD